MEPIKYDLMNMIGEATGKGKIKRAFKQTGLKAIGMFGTVTLGSFLINKDFLKSVLVGTCSGIATSIVYALGFSLAESTTKDYSDELSKNKSNKVNVTKEYAKMELEELVLNFKNIGIDTNFEYLLSASVIKRPEYRMVSDGVNIIPTIEQIKTISIPTNNGENVRIVQQHNLGMRKYYIKDECLVKNF